MTIVKKPNVKKSGSQWKISLAVIIIGGAILINYAPPMSWVMS